MARYAIRRLSDNRVVNCIEWDGASYTAPEGCDLLESDAAGIGDTWDGAQLIKAPPPEPSTEQQDRAMIATLIEKPVLGPVDMSILVRLLGKYI